MAGVIVDGDTAERRVNRKLADRHSDRLLQRLRPEAGKADRSPRNLERRVDRPPQLDLAGASLFGLKIRRRRRRENGQRQLLGRPRNAGEIRSVREGKGIGRGRAAEGEKALVLDGLGFQADNDLLPRLSRIGQLTDGLGTVPPTPETTVESSRRVT